MAEPTSPEQDTVVVTMRLTHFRRNLRWLPILVVLFFVASVLAWMLLEVFVRRGMGDVLPYSIGVAVVALVMAPRLILEHYYERRATLTLSPEGVRFVDPWVTAEAPWDAVSPIDRGSQLAGGPRYVGPRVLQVNPSAPVSREVRLWMWGTLTVTRPSSLYMRYLVRKLYGEFDYGVPTSSRLQVPLTAFEKDWRTGEIGRALHRHRPDVEVPESDDDLPVV